MHPKEGIGNGEGPAGAPRSGQGIWAGSAAAEELGVELQGQLCALLCVTGTAGAGQD